jgi:hypothetical protein
VFDEDERIRGGRPVETTPAALSVDSMGGFIRAGLTSWLTARSPFTGEYSSSWQTFCSTSSRKGWRMLFLVFLCIVLWLLGIMSSYTLGGLLHILLVIAVVLFLVHLIEGRPIGDA